MSNNHSTIKYTPQPARKQRMIRNPEAWVGKVVAYRFGNWWEFHYDEKRGYFVDDWSGKLCRIEDAGWLDPWDEDRALVGDWYDECETYSWDGLLAMIEAAKKRAVKA